MPARWMLAAAVILGLSSTSAPAQEAKLSIGVASAKGLESDLEYLAKLSPAPLNKKWNTLQAQLQAFQEGVDPDKPIRIDLHFTAKGVQHTTSIPYTKLDGNGGFINNLTSFSFAVGKPNASGTREITQQQANVRGAKKKPAAAAPTKPVGYLQDLKTAKYVIIQTEAAGLNANLPDPSKALNQWIKSPVDVAVELNNDAEGLKSRRDNFAEMRKELEAAVPFRRTATEAENELAKLSLQQNLAEAERFVVEAKTIAATWITDVAAKTAKGDLSLDALAGTSLESSIKLLCEKPSAFANVKFHPNPALQLRVNFPIDDLRSGHAKELYPKLLPVLEAEIDKRPALNAAGKTAGKKSLGILFDMLNDAIPMKLLDAFIDVHATADGKHGVVTGIRAADGTKATAALEQFPNIRDDSWKFEKGVAEHGGVTIHALTVAPHRMDEFRAICGGDPVVLVGVSKDIVWGAAGADAMTKLKAAIDQAGAAAPDRADPVFFSLEMRFAPWVELLDIMRKKAPKPPAGDKTAAETERQRNKLRKIAQDAFAPKDDLLQATLRRQEDGVLGEMNASLGVQRFLGSLINFVTDEFLE